MINEKEIHTTPIGTGNYPYLFTPDTQFEKPDGVFTVKFVLSEKEAKPFIPRNDFFAFRGTEKCV